MKARQLRHDAAILDLTLAHAHLELLRAAARVAQTYVADVRQYHVEIAALVRAGDIVARIERESEPADAVAQLDRCRRMFRQRAHSRFDREDHTVRRRQAGER